MTFLVKIDNGGFTYWLKNTIWVGAPERAQLFSSREAAEEGRVKAAPFTKKYLLKKAQIIEVEL